MENIKYKDSGETIRSKNYSGNTGPVTGSNHTATIAGFSRLSPKERTRCLSFCAMMAALSTVIMLTGGLVPVFTYCSPVLASMVLIAVLTSYGALPSVLTWAVTSALVLLIGADKEAAFFYLFLGWYPVGKLWLDRIPVRPLRLFAKTAVLSLAVSAMYGFTCFILKIDEIIGSFSASRWINLGFMVALVLIMLMFDFVLARMTLLYRYRLLPRLKRMKR